MIKFTKFFLIWISLALLLIFFFVRFYGEKIDLSIDECQYPMQWLHASGTKENLEYAVENKFCGVEIDTTLSINQNLIASYNNPNDLNALKLIDLINKNTNIKYWWLDFKNLSYSNFKIASKLINDLSEEYSNKIFLIESHNFIGLWFLNLKYENLYKIYWLSKGNKKDSKINLLSPFYYFRSILANIFINPDFVSMFHYQVGDYDFLWVGNRNRFAFTVKSEIEFKNMEKFGVSVFLVDK